jgi:actin-related protein 9
MFPAEKEGEWEPYKVRPWKPSDNKAAANDNTSTQMERQDPEFYEDYSTEEGAVWPLEKGKIVNWSCLFALLVYVHRRLSPHLHSPMLLVAQPGWTARDYEKLTQFFFEKFKPPCFVIVDSALNALWAYNVVNACVIDVGYEKADVSAITDFSVQTTGRGIMLEDCGGAQMTKKLLKLLESKGFDADMAEQLKRSPICEILPHGAPLPGSKSSGNVPVAEVTNPAAAASTGALGSGPGQRVSGGALGDVPMGPGAGTQVGEETADGIEADGVLDVASIVANNKKMEEFLAKKEREKAERAEKAAKKKGADAAAAAAAASRPQKLRNADKEVATFTYEIPAHLRKLEDAANGTVNQPKDANGQANDENGESNGDNTQDTAPKSREIEVSLERFQAASGGIIEKIADAVHLAISSVEDVAKRSEVWDNLIVVGNGAKIRGKFMFVTIMMIE